MNDILKTNIAVKIKTAACLALAVISLFFLFSGAEGAPVNINDASFEKLLDLDGIDEESAAKIIKYRRENNGFKTIYDLLKVDGITGEIFEKIKDGINVGGAQAGGSK
ncbi:MAG TPA: helix-hairpin-helix domain-containing protein, partial [Candidatus Wallbacteria bacterium]|nr:helix-hairpin-helix domain-containing protein [Candidatus Wallbacteria bacterium]